MRSVLLILIPSAPYILADCTPLCGNAAQDGLKIGGEKLIVLDFQDFDRIVKDRVGGKRSVKQIMRKQTGAQMLVKGDADLFSRRDPGVP